MKSNVIEIVSVIEITARKPRYPKFWKAICDRFFDVQYWTHKYLDSYMPKRTSYMYRVKYRGSPLELATVVDILGVSFLVVGLDELHSFESFSPVEINKGFIKVFFI